MEPYKSVQQSSIMYEDNIIRMVYTLDDMPTKYDLIHGEYLPSCNVDLSTDPYVDKH